MEIDKKITLLVIKEQPNNFTKVIEEECKDPLARWKAFEVQFSYVGFVTTPKFLNPEPNQVPLFRKKSKIKKILKPLP
jgi:hypothetical protein